MTKRSVISIIMVVFGFIAFSLQNVSAHFIESNLQSTGVDINRIKAADVLYSYDDLFYDDYWEVRENYVHTVIYYNNSFSLDHTYSIEATSQADKNAGLTRIRTYHVYNVN